MISQGEGTTAAVATSVSVSSVPVSSNPATATATPNTAGAMSASAARHIDDAADAAFSVAVSSSSSSFDAPTAKHAAGAAALTTSSVEEFPDGYPQQASGDDDDEAIPVAVAEAVPAEPFNGYGASGGAPIHLQPGGSWSGAANWCRGTWCLLGRRVSTRGTFLGVSMRLPLFWGRQPVHRRHHLRRRAPAAAAAAKGWKSVFGWSFCKERRVRVRVRALEGA